MTYLVSIIAGCIGAAVGWISGGIAAPQVAPWLAYLDVPFAGRVADYVGSREIGAGVGLAIGILLALRLYGGHRTKGALVGRGILVGVVAAGLIYGTLEAGGAMFEALGVNPLAPVIEFEIRLPAGSTAPARDDIQIELHTDRNQIIASVTAVSADGGRPVVRASAPLVFRTAQRMIVMSLPGEPVHVFRLRLPARPSPSAEFGPWQQVDFVEEASQQVRRADVTTDYAIRYRVN